MFVKLMLKSIITPKNLKDLVSTTDLTFMQILMLSGRFLKVIIEKMVLFIFNVKKLDDNQLYNLDRE